ncbi:MAG TPA: 16S rRNA (cytidine(1402)-2'-O)-methyltransferase [Thermoanaerobaculia bacterium]
MAQQPRGRFIVVGTPIGNMEDLSPRAAKTLAQADAIFCEDTRVTAKLAHRFGWKAQRISCPEPKERSRVPELLERLEAGQTIALVSDAGMPLLSDPGRELVSSAAAAGYPVLVVPGPSAISAALALSGLPAVPHFFVGFLPSRAGERLRFLKDLARRSETLVWFEAPHRLRDSLEDAASALGERQACVARELTKIHEEAVRGTLSEVAAAFRQRRVRGEATVVVEGAPPAARVSDSLSDLDGEIAAALEAGQNKRDVARELARRSGRSAREIYARAVSLSQDAASGGRK